MSTQHLIARLLPVAVLGLCGLGLAGCDSGYTTQEAYARCEIEQKNSTTVTDDSFKSCVACFEQCGDTCAAQGKVPEEYACPAE
ncbi:MAG: hypothetical protein U0359_06655 [Byssovorax sp.]